MATPVILEPNKAQPVIVGNDGEISVQVVDRPFTPVVLTALGTPITVRVPDVAVFHAYAADRWWDTKVLWQHTLVYGWRLQAGAKNCSADVIVAGNIGYWLSIQKNGVECGRINFAQGSHVGEVIVDTDTDFVGADVISIVQMGEIPNNVYGMSVTLTGKLTDGGG